MSKLLITLLLVGGWSGALAGGAAANNYTGLLSTNAAVNVPALIGGIPASSVYEQLSWSAPTGVQFYGFGYTSATFWVQNFDMTGGISAGFKGSGGSAPTDLNFPWTDDCSISEADSPRTWINNGAVVSSSTRGPGAGTNGYCGPTGGNTTGWNLTNFESESTNPGVNAYTDYQTLTLSVWCARDSACNNSDSGAAAASNLSGNFDDSYGQAAGSASWSGGVNGSSWYQTNSGSLGVSYSAWDPAGICSLDVQLNGPSSANSGLLGNESPGVISEGSPIGEEFQYGTNPCWVGQSNNGTWTLPSGLASGTYSAQVLAANPGDYEAQGFSAGGSPAVAATGNLEIDDVTPTVQLMSPTGAGSWTTSTSATVDVSTGPSGLKSLNCTDNGSGDGATLRSTNGDSYVYTVPLTGGSNAIACSAANNDANGALSSSSGTQIYQQDSIVPSIAFSDVGYAAGTWSASQQSVQVTATGGASGVTALACRLDGKALPDNSGDTDTLGAPGPTQTASVIVPADGSHDLACSAANTGTPALVGSGSFQVDIDTQIPAVSFIAGSGYAATSAYSKDPATAAGQNWLNGGSGPITIGVTGTEPVVDSGVKSIICTINGYSSHPITLTNVPTSGTIAQATPFRISFAADPRNGWIDGQNSVACSAVSLAGLTGANGASAGTTSIEYVDVNDPSWPASPGRDSTQPTVGHCGISSVIDNGNCAYSDGPSQTAWYSSPQTVKITADDTGAAAPITSISCSGVSMPVSSWTSAADSQDVDNHNGLTVTATITAPGGKLDCSASDSASPVDTYELGTYNVSIDPAAPRGFFEPQGYRGAAKNIIQLKLNDSLSGIKQVVVQATDETTGGLYTGAQLTTNPADGRTAYATFDQNTATWNLTVNPGVFPGVNDTVKFVAVAVTGAGVSGTITTAEDGSTEVVTPGGLGDNPTQVTGYSQTGDGSAIEATATAGKWSTVATGQEQLPTALQDTATNPVAPTPVGTVATWKHSVCKSAQTKLGKRRKSASKRPCHAVVSRAPRSEALPAKYNQEIQITGRVMDTTTNSPVAGGSVGIYTTNLATDQVKLVHVELAGPRGNFSYRLAAGPDRRVDLIYLGEWDVHHGADTAFDTTTAGKLRVRASRIVRVGQRMRITGHILGGSIEAKGAIVQMQYLIVGQRGGWEPFKPGRSTSGGTFVIRYPINRGSAGLTYRVRIRVPTQAGWGFRGATSNVLRFRVA